MRREGPGRALCWEGGPTTLADCRAPLPSARGGARGLSAFQMWSRVLTLQQRFVRVWTLDDPLGSSAEGRIVLFDCCWVGNSVFWRRLDLPPSLQRAPPVPSSSRSLPSLEQTELGEGGEKAGSAVPQCPECGPHLRDSRPAQDMLCKGSQTSTGPQPTEAFRMFWSPDQVPRATRAGGGEAGAGRLRLCPLPWGNHKVGRRAAGRRTLPWSPVPQAENYPTVHGQAERRNVGHPHNGTLLSRERERGRQAARSMVLEDTMSRERSRHKGHRKHQE